MSPIADIVAVGHCGGGEVAGGVIVEQVSLVPGATSCTA
jgi:hypothetical protein